MSPALALALVDALPLGVLLFAVAPPDGEPLLCHHNAQAPVLLGHAAGTALAGSSLAELAGKADATWRQVLADGISRSAPAADGRPLTLTAFAAPEGLHGLLLQGDTPAAAATPRTRLLLVEDHPVNRILARRVLEDAGHEVHEAHDGREALARLAEAPYDLVVMDIQMPNLDGQEATRRLRRGEAGEAARTVPVIALTAHAGRDEEARCLEAGMDAFLTKPYVPAALTELVASLLHAPASAPAAPAVATTPGGMDAPLPTELTNLPDLDDSVLGALRDALGDDLHEIVSHFVGQLDEHLAALRANQGAAHLNELSREAHSLKGSAGNLGAVRLSRLAAALEKSAGAGDTRGQASLLAGIEAATHAVRGALSRQGLGT